MLAGVLLLQIWLKCKYANVQFGEHGFNGDEFYLDFYINENFSTKQFAKIESDLNSLSSKLEGISQKFVSLDEALSFFENDQFTKNLLKKSNLNKFKITFFENKHFWIEDLTLTFIKKSFIKLLNVSVNYFLGDPSQLQLQRINGIFAQSKKELEQLIKENEERLKKDHRSLGKQLELFSFDPLIGAGLPIWLAKGATLRNIIGNFVHHQQLLFGFNTVCSPVLANIELFKISGHYQHYKEDMFPAIKLDSQAMMLRPMTCPHHCLIFKQKRYSYKKMPQRFSEDSILHRFEASGGLIGLERVRCMTLLDNHIFCRADQIKSEIKNAFNLIQKVNKKFGFIFDRIDLSLHDPKNQSKFIDNPGLWRESESQMENVLKDLNIQYQKEIGAAAFYGPKIDFQFKTIFKKMITIATIQLDFLLPEKFDLTYIDKKDTLKKPVIIHVGIIGTYERFIAALLEKTSGNFPLWLAPVQAVIIPVNIQKHLKAAKKLYNKLLKENIRVNLDDNQDRLAKKVRQAIIEKIPLQLIVGDKEIENLEKLTCRGFKGEKITRISFNNFVKRVRRDG